MIEFSKWVEMNGSEVLSNFNQTKKKYGILGAEELANISKATEIVASDPTNSNFIRTTVGKLAEKLKGVDDDLAASLRANLQRMVGGAVRSAQMQRDQAAKHDSAPQTNTVGQAAQQTNMVG
jgi:hypothetical protein